MSTLLIYFILTASHRWEFFAIEHINGFGSHEYCEGLADSVQNVYRGLPGNLKIICVDDEGEET